MTLQKIIEYDSSLHMIYGLLGRQDSMMTSNARLLVLEVLLLYEVTLSYHLINFSRVEGFHLWLPTTSSLSPNSPIRVIQGDSYGAHDEILLFDRRDPIVRRVLSL